MNVVVLVKPILLGSLNPLIKLGWRYLPDSKDGNARSKVNLHKGLPCP